MNLLYRLDYEGHIEIVRKQLKDVRPDMGQCNAMICRPTTSGVINEAMIDGVRHPFYIATLSRRVDHLRIPLTDGVFILSATGEANAPAVAELTMELALLLLRPIHRAMISVSNGRFSNIFLHGSRRLAGMTWTSLGTGNIPKSLCQRLINWELGQFNIWHPLMDRHRFATFVKYIAARTAYNPKCVSDLVAQVGPLLITGSSDLNESLGLADIVSVHLPLTFTPDGGYPATAELLGASAIQHMKESACLVNVSSGEIASETAVLAALKSGWLGGYAADNLTAEVEERQNPDQSPIWRTLMSQKNLGADEDSVQKPLNLIITPHIGGTTQDALESISTEVIIKLLEGVGVPPRLYDSLLSAVV